MMKTAIRVLLIVVVAGLLLLACTMEPPMSHWQEIQQAGKITIGTSTDVPPFVYSDAEGEFSGLEVEIIKEMGENLSLQVEIIDMPYDRLVPAVHEGQIDMSVAAFTFSSAIRHTVDFTNPYYIAEDGFLVAAEYSDFFVSPEDIVGGTVGVVSGSPQDEWVRRYFLGIGKLQQDQYRRYPDLEKAVNAVLSNGIDVLMAEAVVLETIAEDSDKLKVVYVGQLSSGSYNMIVPEGDAELVKQVNNAIYKMIDSGYVDEVVIKYMQ
jgi:arginine/lysine/histidine transporter system substrate-binding protein